MNVLLCLSLSLHSLLIGNSDRFPVNMVASYSQVFTDSCLVPLEFHCLTHSVLHNYNSPVCLFNFNLLTANLQAIDYSQKNKNLSLIKFLAIAEKLIDFRT